MTGAVPEYISADGPLSGVETRIVRNAAALMASQLTTWALALVLAVVLPRYLGPRAVGQLQLATTVWTIVFSVVAFGSEMMLTKEIARRPQQAARLLCTVIFLRIIFFVGGCLAVSLYIGAVTADSVQVSLFVILGMAQPLLLTANVLQAALQGFQRMQSIAIATVISKALYTLMALLAVIAGFNVEWVAVATVIGNAAHLCALAVCLFPVVRANWRWGFSIRTARWSIVASAPFLASALLVIAYQETSVIVIAMVLDAQAVGWFSVARTLTATLLFIPAILMTAVYPAAAKRHLEGAQVLPALAARSVRLMLLCAMPIALGVAVTAEPMVSLLYGEKFLPSGAVLMVLGLSLIATYQTIVLAFLLAAVDRQATWVTIQAVALPVKILLDLALVWSCQNFLENGAVGAAVSIAVSEVAIAVAGMRLLPKGTLSRADAGYGARVVFAAVTMAAAVWLVRDASLLFAVLAGVVVYIGMVAVMRAADPEDVALMKSVISRTASRASLRRRVSE